MISGFRLQFTTKQLEDHFDKLVEWWELQATRIASLLERKQGECSAEARDHAREHLDYCGRKADQYRDLRAHLPPDETFLLSLAEAHEIDYPRPHAVSEKELEQRMLHPAPNLLAAIFGGRGNRATGEG